MSPPLAIAALCLVSLSVALTTRRFWTGLLVSALIILPALIPLSLWNGYAVTSAFPEALRQLNVAPFLLTALGMAYLLARLTTPPPIPVALLTLWIVLEISGYLTFGRFPPYWTYLDQGIWMLFPALVLALLAYGRFRRT